LQSITYNAGNGTGSIAFIDPGDAKLWNGTLTKITGGAYAGDLYVTYSSVSAPDSIPVFDDGESGEEPGSSDWLDGGVAGTGGVIINDLAETVPDGTLTAAMLGASVLGLAAFRRFVCV
jgi:hypothetical protein